MVPKKDDMKSSFPSKLTKGLKWFFLCVLGTIIGYFAVQGLITTPAKDKKNKKLSYDRIIDSLNSPSMRIKNAAVISLGNIGRADSIALLANLLIGDAYFTEVCGQYLEKNIRNINEIDFLKIENKVSSLSTEGIVKKREDIEEVNVIKTKLLSQLRRLRVLFNGQVFTEKERALISELDLGKKTDAAINYLEETYMKSQENIGSSFLSQLGALVEIVDNIGKVPFDKAPSNNSEILATLTKHDERLSMLIKKLEYETESDTNRYKAMTRILSLYDKKDVRGALRKLAENESLPISIRLQSIEGLGQIGKQSDLDFLLELMKEDNISINEKVILAMGRLLYKTEGGTNWVEYWADKTQR
jgi:hypothetical protein